MDLGGGNTQIVQGRGRGKSMSEDISALCIWGEKQILGKGMVNDSSWQDVQSRKGLRRGGLTSRERPCVCTLWFCPHGSPPILQPIGRWTCYSPRPYPFRPSSRLSALQLPLWFPLHSEMNRPLHLLWKVIKGNWGKKKGPKILKDLTRKL